MSTEQQQLEAAIAALEAGRAMLGDAVVEPLLAPARAKLRALQASAESLPPQSLRQVSILFLDVVGSTTLSQQLDPEEISAVMDGALARCSTVVDAHKGKVLQYAGDSLLAVFGAREAREDDAERAVRCGLALLELGRALGAEVEGSYGHPDFNVRVGIHTGGVLLGGGVDAEGSIRGIAVNIAARMEQTAPAGRLRISHDTYRHVRGVFDIEPQPPLNVKGLREPVVTYLVQRAKPRAFRVASRGVEGIDTRLIGRATELAQLTDAYEAVLENGLIGFVSLVGDAGLGKSRLLFEFDHWLELRPEAVWFFHSRARPYGHNVPYGLLRDLFAWRFEILDSDSQAVAQAKLAQGFGPLFGERAEEQTALIGELIGLDYSRSPHIAGIAQDARQIRDRAFHAGAQYFRLLQQSTGAPVVLLLDDLHWADDGSLDFVNYVVQACGDIALMVLCLTRPTLYERRPLWGSGQGTHERIDLAPLSRRSSRELADALLSQLDPVPAALRDLLTSSAEGNPFFVEELLGMLIDNGVIVTHSPSDPERWQVVPEKLLQVHVPPTLAALLQTRLDALPPQEKTALQGASVIGHVFWDEPLAHIDAGAPAALEGLMRRDLAQGRATSAFEGVREYAFKHHLLHQVTYDSVLRQHKREQHRLTAEWLVARSGERVSEYHGLIAEHYERAGDVVNAAIYLRKAGEEAARAYANAAALDYLSRALALTPPADSEGCFALLRKRASVFSNMGQRGEQGADIAALERLADVIDDNALRALAGGARAAHAVATGDYHATIAVAERAAAWAEAAGEPGAAVSACFDKARALHFKGDPGAQRHTEQALELARAVGDRRIETAALNQMGILASELGQHVLARDYYQQSLQSARSNNDRALESGVLNNMGDTERSVGHYGAALELLQAGLSVSREIGQRMSEAYMLCNLAWISQARGHMTESLDWAEQAMVLAREVKDRDLEASILGTQGHALAALGKTGEASEAYRGSLAIFRKIGRPIMEPEALAGLARVAQARGAVEEALGHVAVIVAHLDAGGSVDGSEDPMWIFLTCHQVMKAAKAARADEFLRRAHDLLMEQAQPFGPAERESFLGNVPSNRAIVAAWSEREPGT